MRISDWSSDVCTSVLRAARGPHSGSGGAGSGSDPDDSQGRDRPVERRFIRFVFVALLSERGSNQGPPRTADHEEKPQMSSSLARPTHGRITGGSTEGRRVGEEGVCTSRSGGWG